MHSTNSLSWFIMFSKSESYGPSWTTPQAAGGGQPKDPKDSEVEHWRTSVLTGPVERCGLRKKKKMCGFTLC